MKKILLSLVVVFSLMSCNTTNGYEIKGTIENSNDKQIYLLTQNAGGIDTLAKTTVVNDAFEFKGTVNETTLAFINPEGTRSYTQVFLENNTNFTVKINMMNPMETVVEGGEVQKLGNEFNKIGMETQMKQMELQMAYQQAQGDEEKQEAIVEEFNALVADMQAKHEVILKNNPDSYIAAFIVASNMGNYELDELKEKYALLGNNAKNTSIGKDINERITKLENVAVGKVAPDFTLTTPDGGTFSLHGVEGKVKLIDFWASWCGPCRGENPNVVAMYNEYHPKGLEIIGVSLDEDRQAWLQAIEADGLTWVHGSNLKGWQEDVAQMYSVNSIPATFLLDENNRIVAVNLRGEALKAKVAELLD